jgi:hypothetical protein
MTAIIPLCKELLLYYSAYISTTTALSQPLNLSTPQPLSKVFLAFASYPLRSNCASASPATEEEPSMVRIEYEAGTKQVRGRTEENKEKQD